MTIQEIIEMWNGCCSDGESGGGGMKTAHVTVTCTNPDVVNIGIDYSIYDGDYNYALNGDNPQLMDGGAIDLLVGEDNSAFFVGSYNDVLVDLVLESVTGDGEIKENEDGKYLEIHGDCAVTLSYSNPK